MIKKLTYILALVFAFSGIKGFTGSNIECNVPKPPSLSFFITNINNPTACAIYDGDFTIAGLTPSTSYFLTYNNVGVVGPTLITTDLSGEYKVTGLSAGSYTDITISDGSNFFVQGPVVLNAVGSPTFTLSSIPPSTCGGTDATITISGLIASMNYDLSYNDGVTAFGPFPITTDGSGNYTITNIDAGSYSSFTLDIFGCIGSVLGPEIISNPNIPTVVASNNGDICVDETYFTLDETGGEAATWTWYSNGSATITDITDPNPIVTGATDGEIFTVIGIDSVGCSDSSTTTITINPLPNFILSGVDPLTCGSSNGSITISGLTPNTSYSLTYYDDGILNINNIVTDPTGSKIINGQNAGSYTNFQISDGICSSDLSSIILSDVDAPVFTVNSAPSDSCINANGEISIQGLFQNTNYDLTYIADTSIVGPITIITDGSGNYNITGLDVGTYTSFNIDSIGCIGSATGPIIIEDTLSPLVFANATLISLCENDTLTLFGSGASTYTWTNGVIDNTPFPITSSTIFTVIGIDTNGCTGTDSIAITATPSDDPSFNYNQSIYCPEDSVAIANITGLTGGEFAIDNNGVFDSITGQVNLLSNNIGSYNITYTTNGVCPESSTETILISSLDDAEFTFSDFCVGQENEALILGTSGGVFTFNPEPNDGATINSSTGAITNAISGNSYTIDYSTNGSCPANSVLEVSANPDNLVCDLIFYSGITPNDDNLNDSWIIKGIEIYSSRIVHIYNRWGNLVWEGENYDNDEVVWKGENQNDQPLPIGVYYYIVQLDDLDYSGYIEVTR